MPHFHQSPDKDENIIIIIYYNPAASSTLGRDFDKQVNKMMNRSEEKIQIEGVLDNKTSVNEVLNKFTDPKEFISDTLQSKLTKVHLHSPEPRKCTNGFYTIYPVRLIIFFITGIMTSPEIEENSKYKL